MILLCGFGFGAELTVYVSQAVAELMMASTVMMTMMQQEEEEDYGHRAPDWDVRHRYCTHSISLFKISLRLEITFSFSSSRRSSIPPCQ